VTDRRNVIADAAISTIAREGMRGFTHRAVDRTAALPEGSTSYYFRTREALMFAALARMAELDMADVGDTPELAGTVDMETMATLTAAVLLRWLTEARERTLARFELALESTRRPELRARMRTHGASFRYLTEKVFATMGASEPARRAQTFVAHLDGLMLHQLTRDEFDEDELRSACRDLLTMALA
jgi:DNA-binding transcriptional regulator YbjK